MTEPPPPAEPGGPPPYGQLPKYGQAPGPYDQSYGYGPPGVPNAPGAGNETGWAMGCYLGTLAVGFLAPLVIYFVKRRSPFPRFHAAQVLNYQITILIQVLAPLVVAVPLAILTDSPAWLLLALPVFLFHSIAQLVFLILGTIKASQNQWYRLPVWTCFRMIR